MAYEAVTEDDFYRRFPSFDNGTIERDYQVDALIAEAPVDQSWIEKDYKPAILYWVAHMLTTETGTGVDRGTITSESFGPMSASYATGDKQQSALASTEYGRRFLELQRNNFPGIKVIGC